MSFENRDFQRNRAVFMAEQRLAFTVRPPTAFMCITGLSDGYERPTINLGRLWTRHMPGIIEAERDQRRRARGRR